MKESACTMEKVEMRISINVVWCLRFRVVTLVGGGGGLIVQTRG